MLNKIKFLVILFFGCLVFDQSSAVEPRDFFYKADLHLKENENMFGVLTEIISESEMKASIRSLRTFEQSGHRVASMHSLEDRVQKDVEQIYKKTHALGFYNTEISYKIYNEMDPVLVEVYVNLGKPFHLEINVEYVGLDEVASKKYKELLKSRVLLSGASLPEIRQVIENAIFDLKSSGYYDPKVLEKRVYLKHSKRTAVLNLKIDPGEQVKFSNTVVKAFPEISEEYLRNRIDWDEGEIFDVRKIESTTEILRNSQIFSDIKIQPIESEKENDKIPMLLAVEKNKSKVVDLSLLYSGTRRMNFKRTTSTSKKKLRSFVARLSWTDYNAFGNGETLGFIVEGSPGKNKLEKDANNESSHRDYLFEVSLAKPDVFIKNLTLNGDISRKQELSNTFFKKCDKVSVIGDYPLKSGVHLRIGGVREKNYVDSNEIFFTDPKMHKAYNDYAIPIEIYIDRTNNLLNPTSGYRLSAKFVRTQFRNMPIHGLNLLDSIFSYHYALNESNRDVVAFQIEYRTILNAALDNIPLDKRIYAGGIGSVRGYGKQMATELVKSEKIPMGGKGAFEFSAEYRRKITSTIGGVLFFDGARIFKNKSEKAALEIEKKRWFLSSGIGFRYFSSIGPIRVDFAFPIKRRKGIDSKMQFIISLGQAF